MRVDTPTLQCDRCKKTTQDTAVMMSFNTITHYHMGGHDEWDLCPSCWEQFGIFLKEDF